MAELIYAGSTSQTIDIFIADSSSAVGAGLAGLVFNTASLTAYSRKGATGTATAITLATQTVGGAYSSGGFVEIDATNQIGMYRFDIPNALIDTSGFTHIVFQGAANMAPTILRIDCRAVAADVKLWLATAVTLSGNNKPDVNVDEWHDVALAVTDRLPNAAPGVANGVFIAGTNAATVVTTSFTTTFTGNLTGSVASVTGTVASVIGAVGSVTGTVGSVTGSVGSVAGSVGSVVGHTAQTGDTFALANGAAGFVAIDTVVDAILVDTNELQTDWADGGRLDLIQDIIAVDTTTDIPALIATAQLDLDTITGATGVNLLAATQASIDAIELDTTTDIPALIATIAGYLDTEIASILTHTGTSIPALIATAQADLDTITGATGVNLLTATQASIDAIEVDTDELQTDWVDGGRLDVILDGAGGGGGSDTATFSGAALAEIDAIKAKTDTIGTAAGVTTLLAASVLVTGTITAFPSEIVIGDSYTTANGRAIQIPIVDTDGLPIATTGTLNFADANATFVIQRVGETDATRIITGTATFVDPPGTGTSDSETPYALIEMVANQTAKGLIGYKYSGVLTFTWPGTGSDDDVMSFETATIQFDN